MWNFFVEQTVVRSSIFLHQNLFRVRRQNDLASISWITRQRVYRTILILVESVLSNQSFTFPENYRFIKDSMKSTSLLTVTTLFQVHILLITNQDGSFIHKTFRGISVKVLDPVGAKTVAFVEVQRVIIHNFGRVQRTNVFLFVPMEHLIGYLHVKVLIDHRVRTIITSYHNS